MEYSLLLQHLSRKPLLGFTGSILTISITHLQILQIIGAVFGIMIALITVIIKLIELKDKLVNKKSVVRNELVDLLE